MKRVTLTSLIVLLVLAACAAPGAAGPDIHIENAWARPAMASSMGETNPTPDMQAMTGATASQASPMPDMPGMTGDETTSAAYLVIVNDGNEADTLIGATSDAANQAEVHETQINNDVAQMIPVPRLDIPAHGQVEFSPGGYHVMLVGLTQDLIEGQTIKLTLQFEKSGAITIDVPVQQEN